MLGPTMAGSFWRSCSCVVAWTTCLCIIAVARAQEKAAPEPAAATAAVEPMEAEMLALGAKELAAYAAMSFKNGFPMRARVAWQEVIGEYAPDDEASRKALGFVRMGTVWQRDPKFEYPEQDQPNSGVAHMLEQKWDAVAQKLGDGHRALAAQLATAGKTQRSQYHSTRALRFLPKDAKVVAQSGLKQVERIAGDDIDLEILRRSRLMDRAITRLSEQQFAANVVKEENPLLQKAGMP